MSPRFPSTVIDQMLVRGQITRVAPNRAQSDQLLTHAEAHLRSAQTLRDADTAGAFALAYDAARKALTGSSGRNGDSVARHGLVGGTLEDQGDPRPGPESRDLWVGVGEGGGDGAWRHMASNDQRLAPAIDSGARGSQHTQGVCVPDRVLSVRSGRRRRGVGSR